MHELKIEKSSVERQLHTSVESNQVKEQEINDLETEKFNIDKELRNSAMIIKEKHQEIDILKLQLEEHEVKLQKASDHTKDLENDLETKKIECEHAEKQSQLRATELNQMLEQNNSLKAELEINTEALSDSKTRCERLEEDFGRERQRLYDEAKENEENHDAVIEK